jgi:hypothetical protein
VNQEIDVNSKELKRSYGTLVDGGLKTGQKEASLRLQAIPGKQDQAIQTITAIQMSQTLIKSSKAHLEPLSNPRVRTIFSGLFIMAHRQSPCMQKPVCA